MPPTNPPQNPDSTDKVPPVLSTMQKTQPYTLTWAAVLLTVLSLGWQAFSKQDAETADQVTQNHTAEITQVMSIVMILAGSVFHKRNEEKTEGAVAKAKQQIEVAAAAPPVNINGEYCPYHTLSIGLQQLVSRKRPGDLEAAQVILESLKKVEDEAHA